MAGVRWLWVFLAVFTASCSVRNAKNHYILAEKLWADSQYDAAVTEFERVTAKDPTGLLGQQALYRGATTQALFLYQYNDALRKLRAFVEVSRDTDLVWDARLLMGEIYFAKLELYEQAIQHYQQLLAMRPDSRDAPEFMYRIAKSQFYRAHFEEAVAEYQRLIRKVPKSSWAEKASFEIAQSHFTRGDADGYQEAIDAYNRFIKKYPKSDFVPQVQFGLASCMEEMDQLESAYHAFEALKSTYPSPQTIDVKLARIRDRMNQRRH